MTKPAQRDSPSLAEVPARVIAAELGLRAAFDRVHAKAGMPGADGIATHRFARALDANLAALEARLARGTYRPLPLRAAELEKKSGGRRLLLIPSVADRVAQSAAAEWLSRRWNPRFDPHSFAYRPGLGVLDALHALEDLRNEGYRWVLDADVEGFFDNISHSHLERRLEDWLGESSPMMQWLRSWIRAAVWDGSGVFALQKGVPQGSPLSPVLSNYYLDEFDRRLREKGIRFVRYADDFLALAKTPFELEDVNAAVRETLASLELRLNENKTRVTTFDKTFRFLGAEVRADAIMQPIPKRVVKRKPVWVAPVMPSSLARAWKQGHLGPPKPFVWKPGAPTEDPAPKAETRSKAKFGGLSGTSTAAALLALRKGACR